jgi:hypothetical protein
VIEPIQNNTHISKERVIMPIQNNNPKFQGKGPNGQPLRHLKENALIS